jgi:regulator of RNase E activity RraA
MLTTCPPKKLNKLPRDDIRMRALPQIPADIIERFKALIDLSGTISEACEELGIIAFVAAFERPRVNYGKRIVGPALTVRNIRYSTQIHKAAQDKISDLGETAAPNLATAGDVLVMQREVKCKS